MFPLETIYFRKKHLIVHSRDLWFNISAFFLGTNLIWKPFTSWSCSYKNDVLMWRWKKPPVDPKIHRVDIAYDISLNAEYVHTFGIRLPNIIGKYWRGEFKKFYCESRLYFAPPPSNKPPPPPPFQGKKVN